MVVARNCRKRRSLTVSNCSPTSLTLPLEGTSAPFCNSPITVSEVTDLPEPLSPTRHSVSPSLTLSERPSMMRLPPGFLPRPKTRLSMSRTMLVMSPFSKRHCEERSDEAIHSFLTLRDGLLRFARNDGRDHHHLPLSRCFMGGSSASRAGSPIRLTLRIAIDSSRPGQKISEGLVWKKARPSAMMLPQVGVSGLRPAPRNDRIASVRTAEAQT